VENNSNEAMDIEGKDTKKEEKNPRKEKKE